VRGQQRYFKISGTTKLHARKKEAMDNKISIRDFMNNGVEQEDKINISDWLDEKEEENFDVSQIVLPDDLSYDEVPDETIFFEEINPDGILSIANHPFSTVERFGHWYYCRGREKATGTDLSGKEWRLFTKNKDLALKTAKSHIE
jgi:hypothetical protein